MEISQCTKALEDLKTLLLLIEVNDLNDFLFSVFQMHEMLQLLHQDGDSETGSYTDSGRGPSEEGDNGTHTTPLDQPPADDSKGKMEFWLQNSAQPIIFHLFDADIV